MKNVKPDGTRWTGLQLGYEEHITDPNSDDENQYCLTDSQVKAILAISQPYLYVTRWFHESDPDPSLISHFVNDLHRRLLMPCCNDDLIFTYDEDGNLVVSSDGGTVYVPAPEDDIRLNPRVIFPEPGPTEGADELCLAADGMKNLIKEQVGDQLTDDMSRYTLGQLIHDWTTTMIGTSNPFVALVQIVANQIFALLVSAVVAALTDPVYARLRCIFSNRMSMDISFTEGTWEDVRDDILSQISGVAGIFLEHLVYLLGPGGLTNLARSQAGVDDSACCADCDPMLWSIWNGEENYGTVVEYGSNYVTIDLMSAPSTVGEYYGRMKTDDIDTCCIIAGWEVLSGGTLNISAGGACGEAQTGGGGLSISETEPSGPFNRFAFGATGACRVKITFQ